MQRSININVFSKDILVLDCIVAGTSFRDVKKVEDQLNNQVKVELKREVKNEFDNFAVAIYFQRNKIGYFPRTKNEVVAVISRWQEFLCQNKSERVGGKLVKTGNTGLLDRLECKIE